MIPLRGDNMVIKINENIRKYRKELALTQEQLAEAVGVTIGAVSKWESGLSTPDISMIVTLADFFEISVDVLLGYELGRTNPEKAAEEIKRLRHEKMYEKGQIEVDKYLQKYPNRFNVVYESAKLFLMKGIEYGDIEALKKSLLLHQRACKLIDQNMDETISEISLQNSIGTIYMALGEVEKSVEHLKKYNYGGINNGDIGFYLIMSNKFEEAIPYLSESFIQGITGLFKTMIGYVNYYSNKKEHKKALEILEWMHEFLKGLRTDKVCYIDKLDVMIFTLCSLLYCKMGEVKSSKAHLRKAKVLAEKFDATPDYNLSNIKYCSQSKDSLSDDFGVTARQGIEKVICENAEIKEDMMKIWKEILREGE